MKNEEKNLLAAFYGKKAFVKIKQCLEINKIQFSFVDLENTKNHVDIYMEAEEFGCILMGGIKNGTLIKVLLAEKAKGEKYPKPVWTSPVGGNATGNEGNPISRYFEISPASDKGEVLFTALAFPAEENATGAFIKKKGSKALTTLRVPCTYNDLRILQYKWSFLEADFMGNKYTLANMKSDYKPKVEDTYSPAPTEEEDTAPTTAETPKTEAPKSESKPKTVKKPVEEPEVPFGGTDGTKTEPKTEPKAENKKAEVKVISLIATSELIPIPDKPIKVCKVTADGETKRLVCMTDKFRDLKRLAEFERQVKAQVARNQTLKFKGEVCEKGDDLYLTKFA